jgi:hypothetical protein
MENANRGKPTAWKIKREGSELYRNHIYVDLVDTPADNFEEYLAQHLDKTLHSFLHLIDVSQLLFSDDPAKLYALAERHLTALYVDSLYHFI